MASEKGFKFEIKGEVFIKQASNSGEDVVAAFNAALKHRTDIASALDEVPATFTIGDPVLTSRRVEEPEPKPEPKK